MTIKKVGSKEKIYWGSIFRDEEFLETECAISKDTTEQEYVIDRVVAIACKESDCKVSSQLGKNKIDVYEITDVESITICDPMKKLYIDGDDIYNLNLDDLSLLTCKYIENSDRLICGHTYEEIEEIKTGLKSIEKMMLKQAIRPVLDLLGTNTESVTE